MIKRSILALFIALLFNSNQIDAQDVKIVNGNQLDKPVQTAVQAAATQTTPQTVTPDTLPLLELDETELNKIPDLRTQFERLNGSYSSPVAPSENLLRFLKKDEIELSAEALYWVNWVRDPATIISPWATLQDTTIVNPLFTPILFKGGLIPADLQLYDKDFVKKQRPDYSLFTPDTTLFEDETLRGKLQNMAYNYVRVNHPEYFRYSESDLPTDIVQTHVIKKATYEPELIKIENDPNAFNDVDAPVKFIPERRYWTSNFESSIQFAQAYFSPNWHDGNQNTNINLNTRNYFRYDYNKNKVKLTNELELRISANNAPKDTVRSVSITDNDIRLHSNFGYQAYGKWYYSFDLNINSKIFDSYKANDTVTRLSGFLAPMTLTLGIGMKYNLDKQLNGNKHRKIHFDINLAPLSMTYRYSRYKERFDFGRHGFDGSKVDDDGRIRNHQTYFGSNIKANLRWQFNRRTIWTSRFEYDTSYHRIFWIFENRLETAISRFFSTQITLNMRYDDAGRKNIDFKDTYLQINEALTFGFSYRW